MAVIRTYHNKENPFVQINKKALWDENLSLEAVGLWARLLSRPDDWTFNVSEIAKSCGCGKERIYRILNELVDNGYAQRSQPRDQGRFQSFDTHVFEFKMTKEEIQKMFTETGFPYPVLPDAEVSVTGNPDTTNTEDTINIKEKREEAAPPTPPLFSHKRVKMDQSKYENLVNEYGLEKIKIFIDRLDEYADINPKRFKQYACHAAVVRKWIREDKEKGRPPRVDNEKYAEELCKKLNHPMVQFYRGKCLLIQSGGAAASSEFKFTENGFKEQVLNRLRKMELITHGMEL